MSKPKELLGVGKNIAESILLDFEDFGYHSRKAVEHALVLQTRIAIQKAAGDDISYAEQALEAAYKNLVVSAGAKAARQINKGFKDLMTAAIGAAFDAALPDKKK